MKLEKNDVILFDGDSITDGMRDRSDYQSLAGYNKIIQQTLDVYKPELAAQCFNRGISGDTSAQLLARLDDDICEVNPSVISILIGVNDSWRRYDNNKTITTPEQFEQNMREILSISLRHCKKVVLLEQFFLTSDPNKNHWRDDLDPKIQITRKLAREYDVTFIPLDGVFTELSIINGDSVYTPDSVHPTHEGNCVIAKEWLRRML